MTRRSTSCFVSSKDTLIANCYGITERWEVGGVAMQLNIGRLGLMGMWRLAQMATLNRKREHQILPNNCFVSSQWCVELNASEASLHPMSATSRRPRIVITLPGHCYLNFCPDYVIESMLTGCIDC